MSLRRLYSLSEATRRDHQLTQAEVERHFPEALPYFDRDVAAQHATFYATGDEYQNLVANTKGNGWWMFHGRSYGEEGSGPHWEKIQKPGSWRGERHRARDNVNVPWPAGVQGPSHDYPNINSVRKEEPRAYQALKSIPNAKDFGTFYYDDMGRLTVHFHGQHYVFTGPDWTPYDGGEYSDVT